MNRTKTIDITTFELPSPDAATFTFSSSSPTSPDATIRIVVPVSSRWSMPLHWHPSENETAATCNRITCVSGILRIYVSLGLFSNYDYVGTGIDFTPEPGQHIAWNHARKNPQVPLVVDLVADHDLWRNICSAILDRGIFPQLASTPLWLKALYTVVATIPVWGNKFLNVMLWIQLQSIFIAHNFHVNHGQLPVTLPWMLQPFGGEPPDWAERLEWHSKSFISRIVMTAAYWVGTIFLGMRGEYVEYTPSRDHVEEKR